MAGLPFRAVHLDFHTSRHIHDVGAAFDADEFGDTLVRAHVDSVTCFARCHHGYIYYNSEAFSDRLHPNLTALNLLQDQLEACRKRSIRAPIYITVQWDEFTANEHPEWLSVDETGAWVGQPFDHGTRAFEAGFYRALCINSPYREWLKAFVKDVIDNFPGLDGLFFDIIFVNDCACRYCREGMAAMGLNPADQQQRLDFALRSLDEFVLDMSRFIRTLNLQCSIFYNKSHIGTVHRPVLDAYSHFELESLPGGGTWGYWHFPIAMRYARTLGKECVGMTGKFHTEWGDFRSYKNKAALEYECFRMLALGAKCSIGDQLEPDGKITSASYDLIGQVYEQVELKEPWCREAVALADIGLLTPEEFVRAGDTSVSPSLSGAAKMLTEGAHQFDIVDSTVNFAQYQVIVLPDSIPVSEALSVKLQRYLEQGGKILASFESGMNEARSAFALSAIPAVLRETSFMDQRGRPVRGRVYKTFDYADYILPQGDIAAGLRDGEHVMYIKGREVDADSDSKVLAQTIKPYFYRTWEKFCSHRQTPPSGQADGAAIIQKDGVIYFAHPIFQIYQQWAPHWCKQLMLNALRLLLADPLLRHDGPSTLLATVNAQTDQNRWIVHLLHYIPERRCDSLDIIEDVIPLTDIRLSLHAPDAPVSIQLVPQSLKLHFSYDGRIEVVIPRVEGHQMICVQFR